MAKISEDNFIQRTSNFLDTQLDDEIIMLQMETGKIFAVSDSAKFIWQQLVEPVTIKNLIEQLIEIYDIETGRCRDEVICYIDELMKQGFVCVKSFPEK